MFQNCTNLSYVEVNWTEWPDYWSLRGPGGDSWLDNVSPTGIFKKPRQLVIDYDNWFYDSSNGDLIPSGWTIVDK